MKKAFIFIQQAAYILLVVVTVLISIQAVINFMTALFSSTHDALLFSTVRLFVLYYILDSIIKSHYKQDWKLITWLQIGGVFLALVPLIKQVQTHQTLLFLPLILQAFYTLLLILSKYKFEKEKPKTKYKLPKKLEFLNKDL